MKIIITAAGGGTRFLNYGIDKPKYKIIANDKPLFYWAVNSLKNFFDYPFIFIFRKEIYDSEFVKYWLDIMKIKNHQIILIDKITDGQGETALFADHLIEKDEPIMIYNIDTLIKPESLDSNLMKCDGSITVSKAPGEHWSFAKLGTDGFVSEVSEKKRISQYASVGPYYFAKWSDFKWVLKNYKNQIMEEYKEAYVCPMYQYLINKGKKIIIYEIKNDDFVCLGTPQEIQEFDKNWIEKN